MHLAPKRLCGDTSPLLSKPSDLWNVFPRNLLRLEIEGMKFPDKGGDVVVGGTYVNQTGEQKLADAKPIAIADLLSENVRRLQPLARERGGGAVRLKVAVDLALFFAAYKIQDKFIFKTK